MSDAPAPSTSAAADAPGPSAAPSVDDKPLVLLVIGMAGSGKTAVVSRLAAHVATARPDAGPAYLVNLDPAVAAVPYEAAIDIRDTVNYKNVMRQYGLGPNGAILTSLNLFATRFDQVVTLLEKPRTPPLRLVAVDTPGQIEIFTWSASGAIMTDALGASLPTAVLYVVDAPRCASPPAFVANLLQAASILYRTRLPLLLAFNKSDVAGAAGVADWLTDWDALDAALADEKSYAATLSRSLSLVLDEFTAAIPHVCVSAATGAGFDELLGRLGECRAAYEETYLADLVARRGAAADREAERQAGELERMRLDGVGG